MPWISAKIKRDTENSNIGTVTATWEVKVATVTTEYFVYEDRVNRSPAGRTAFVTAAKAALATYQTQLTQLNNAEATILTELNA